MPAGEVDDGVDLASAVVVGWDYGASLLGEGGGFFGVVRLQREVDDEGFSDDGFARNEAPVAAVFAVVAVVADDEEIAGGDDEVVFSMRERMRIHQWESISGSAHWRRGKLSRKLSGGAGAIDGVGLD